MNKPQNTIDPDLHTDRSPDKPDTATDRIVNALNNLPPDNQFAAILNVVETLVAQLPPDDVAILLDQLFTICRGRSSDENHRKEIADALNAVVNEQQRRSRRPPLTFKRIRKAFAGRETDLTTLDDIQAEGFSQPKIAQNAIAQMDKELRKHGYKIEHIAAYRILPLLK